MSADERHVPLGEIVATHGLDGWFKLNPFNPSTVALSPGALIFAEADGQRREGEIEDSKPHKRQFLVKIRGVDSIDAAARWVGSTLLMSESALEPLGPGEYYHFQVMGFEVVDQGGAVIGTIRAILSTPGGEIYVVRGAAGEHLIPAVSEIVEHVDFNAGKMVINPPAGLLDL